MLSKLHRSYRVERNEKFIINGDQIRKKCTEIDVSILKVLPPPPKKLRTHSVRKLQIPTRFKLGAQIQASRFTATVTFPFHHNKISSHKIIFQSNILFKNGGIYQPLTP